MDPTKTGGKRKKGHSVVNKVVTREYIINIHKHIHGVVGFKKSVSQALNDIKKFAMNWLGTPEVHIDAKAVWAKGNRNVPYYIHVQLSGKHNEDEDSLNKLYTMVTYVSFITFRNLQTATVDEN
ncbi:PREDICTED: 60S ribosomal protein L31-like [Chrysochloris asiatica]|uniref:Large ribosomal subunit protein eL31 n=1 Tax=Chrysochloris asiatica TaxID=185453 RepID=A0A9B0U5H2_CHRAS|nr:PREDICTED: 60S ribosomal protein L31-like [Chrysochloris asiatica]